MNYIKRSLEKIKRPDILVDKSKEMAPEAHVYAVHSRNGVQFSDDGIQFKDDLKQKIEFKLQSPNSVNRARVVGIVRAPRCFTYRENQDPLIAIAKVQSSTDNDWLSDTKTINITPDIQLLQIDLKGSWDNAKVQVKSMHILNAKQLLPEVRPVLNVSMTTEDKNELWINGSLLSIRFFCQLIEESVSNVKLPVNIEFSTMRMDTKYAKELALKKHLGNVSGVVKKRLVCDLGTVIFAFSEVSLKISEIQGLGLKFDLNYDTAKAEVTIMDSSSKGSKYVNSFMEKFEQKCKDYENKRYKSVAIPHFLPNNYKEIFITVIKEMKKPDIVTTFGQNQYVFLTFNEDKVKDAEDFVEMYMKINKPSETKAAGNSSFPQSKNHNFESNATQFINIFRKQNVAEFYEKFQDTIKSNLVKNSEVKLDNVNSQLTLYSPGKDEVKPNLKVLADLYAQYWQDPSNPITQDSKNSVNNSRVLRKNSLVESQENPLAINGETNDNNQTPAPVQTEFRVASRRMVSGGRNREGASSRRDRSRNRDSVKLSLPPPDNPQEQEAQSPPESDDDSDKWQSPPSPKTTQAPIPTGQSGTSYIYKPSNTIITVSMTSMVNITVDAIVNPANEELDHVGGLARVIANAAGKGFERECQQYVKSHGEIETGEVCVTGAGNLKQKGIKKVIHAVGPVWEDIDKELTAQQSAELLRNCYWNSLSEVYEHKLTSVAFPSISAGVFGAPMEEVAKCAVSAITDFLKQGFGRDLETIYLLDIYMDRLDQYRTELSKVPELKLLS